MEKRLGSNIFEEAKSGRAGGRRPV